MPTPTEPPDQHGPTGAGTPGPPHARRSGDAGQATAEYALVILGAALIAALLVAWATAGGGAGRIGALFDAVLDAVLERVR